jgi:hypothetical protein
MQGWLLLLHGDRRCLPRVVDDLSAPLRIFAGEDFGRCGLNRGNGLLPNPPPTTHALLFSQAYRHVSRPRPFFSWCATRGARSAGVEEVWKMRQLRALLRGTPSRLRRRIAVIVAIAAASLPAAGA